MLLMMVLVLNFLGTIYLIFQKSGIDFRVHLFLSLLFMVIGFLALIGVLHDRPWTYQLGMLLFAAILLHDIILLHGSGRIYSLIGLSFINMVAFLLCIASLESYQERKWRVQEARKGRSPKEAPKPMPKVESYEEKTVAKTVSKKTSKKK